ncbi:MAG: biotin--[acetyl-CoA-carboxylase] ligase [Armatimonadetes bacterium]|nr:biotin--[acetyl-CoA-carboxylase] ligase [Armatimonadota bacterium]
MITAVQQTKWIGKNWRFFEVVESTQDVVREWILNGAPHGAIVIADRQTCGRGRIGRSWFSPPGKNLYFTVAMQLSHSHPPLGTLSLLIGVAVAEALRKFSDRIFVKWANDVVSELGRKLAGILVEGFEPEPKKVWALVGVGINVNITENDFPDDLRPIATSLSIVCSREFDRFEVLAKVLCSLEFWWGKWENNELDLFWQAYDQLDWLKGKRVRAFLPDGTEVEGTAAGITFDGELRLILPEGTERRLIAGDVSVRTNVAS